MYGEGLDHFLSGEKNEAIIRIQPLRIVMRLLFPSVLAHLLLPSSSCQVVCGEILAHQSDYIVLVAYRDDGVTHK